MNSYFATCARGLEPVLADELQTLQAQSIEIGRGGVQFQGDLPLLYKANLYLRTAVRVLQKLIEGEVHSTDDLYNFVKGFAWSKRMTPEHTLAVDSNVRDSEITHSLFAALRVKDAICDQFLESVGRRPSVDRERPMIGLNLHISQNHAVLSLDSSGDSLHKRGYRPIQTRAPLNEALAAGLILLSGWKGECPLIDPLCGSGTFCIEAAWIALQRPPGLTRKHFGFQGWMNFDIQLWSELREQARINLKKTLPFPIQGFDARRDAIQFAQTNARAAGIGNLLQFQIRELEKFESPKGPAGILIANPPYGERIGEEKDLRPLYRLLGDTLKHKCPSGWKLILFTGNGSLARSVGMDPVRRIHLFNGKIPCQFLEYIKE